MKNLAWILVGMASLLACNEPKGESLPIYGETSTTDSDTIYHTIGNFGFYDQDSTLITDESVEGKVYVADFFFTSCPSICIPMAKQMLRVHKRFGDHPDFMILSHSLDPEYDTVPVLKQYASGLGIEAGDRWHFLTGGETDVFSLGEQQYFVTAKQDQQAPGGVLHSGAFVLVDQQGRIRGVYDGTNAEKVDQLMLDIDRLLTSAN